MTGLDIAASPALSTAVRTWTAALFAGAVFTAAFTGFLALAPAAMLTSGVPTFSLGDALTYRGTVRIPAVFRSLVDRAAADYHRGEHGSQDCPDHEFLRH